MINCIIIDDEQFAVDVLLKYIKLMTKLKVVDVYLKPEDALEKIGSHKNVDIIFMDIDMPNLSGLDLAHAIKSKTDKIIFTTSHTRYAYDAYEAEGDAFLLKPFSYAKFAATINRFFPGPNEISETKDYFLIKSKDDNLKIVKVIFDQIIAFESLSNYVKIHLTENRTITVYLNIKDVLDLLHNRKEFIQVHRAFIISTTHIESIANYALLLKNDMNINVGEIYRNKFNSFLSENLVKTTRKVK